YPRFLKGRSDFRSTDKAGVYFVAFTDEVFSAAWLNSSVPVIFDFKGDGDISDKHDIRNHLYCLFPQRIGRDSIVVEIPRSAFVKTSVSGEWSSIIHRIIQHCILLKQE